MADTDARLYLLTPRLGDASTFAPTLIRALEAADVACVLVRFASRDEGEAKKIVKALAPLVQSRGVALLVEGAPTLAARTDADGVHVSAPGDALEAAIASMKPSRIVGAGGLALRDDAMVAGERDVDYILFGEPRADGSLPDAEETLERVAWWAEIFNTPCVGYAATLDAVAPLAAAGAEFVALGDAVWDDPRGVAAALEEATRAMRVPVAP